MTCLFCDIVDKKLPSYVLYENDDYMAFLDRYPSVPGHTLVIPKKHYRWVYDDAHPGDYWNAVHTVTHMLQKALMPVFVNYYTYGSVPHAHIHVLPRPEHIESRPDIVPSSREASEAELQHVFDRIMGSRKL